MTLPTQLTCGICPAPSVGLVYSGPALRRVLDTLEYEETQLTREQWHRLVSVRRRCSACVVFALDNAAGEGHAFVLVPE